MIELLLNIEEKYKQALINKETTEIRTLRLIKSAIKDKEISQRTEKNKDKLDEQAIISILQSLIKQRNESIELYKKGNRINLVEEEMKEIEIIKFFLPKQLNLDETKEVISNIIKDNSFNSIKDMGQIMKILKNKYSGKIDFSEAGKVAKDLINSK